MIDTQAIRKKILDLAMRGQLTEQCPEDGTAEELFQKIQEEKKSLIKCGKVKKDKAFSESPVFKPYPFDIPKNWKFVRFGELMINRDSERIPVSVADRRKRKKLYDYYGASGVIDGIDDFLFDKDLLLIGEDGANLLARSSPIAFIASGKYWVNNHAHVLDVCSGTDMRYICRYINAISLEKYVTGSAQPKMNQENMNAIWVALPPYNEQQRIVEKIDQAFSVLDTIDSLQAQYADNLTALKAKLIDAAIQGKLTEQLPEDGTAEELYEKIQEEKQALIKAGMIKKEKSLSEITADEIPFKIPEHWKWCRIGEIFTLQAGKNIATGSIQDHPDKDNQYPCYGGNGLRGYVNQFNVNGLHALIGRQGALCGNINFASGEFYATEHAVVVYEYSGTNMQWAGLTLRALNLNQYATSVAQPGLAVNKINKVLIPLPPLAEQKRIAQKIDELMPLFEK